MYLKQRAKASIYLTQTEWFSANVKNGLCSGRNKKCYFFKLGGTPVGVVSDPKFGLVWSFVKTYQN